ncbi:N-6 DNA methylase [Salmonella enterica subsp. enterica serovar Weltevreden]|nr:N-6 DNA methylase [Salmonella enterica subsp. enterica serovar Weltevreden]
MRATSTTAAPSVTGQHAERDGGTAGRYRRRNPAVLAAPRARTAPSCTRPATNSCAFMQHIIETLRPAARRWWCRDNVLFERRQKGADIRRDLMDRNAICAHHPAPADRHLCAQGVKTNVLFFTKGTRSPIRIRIKTAPMTFGCMTCGPICRASASARRLPSSTCGSRLKPSAVKIRTA